LFALSEERTQAANLASKAKPPANREIQTTDFRIVRTFIDSVKKLKLRLRQIIPRMKDA
jgi:hypothetical protein